MVGIGDAMQYGQESGKPSEATLERLAAELQDRAEARSKFRFAPFVLCFSFAFDFGLYPWGHSSHGRAVGLHPTGRGIDALCLQLFFFLFFPSFFDSSVQDSHNRGMPFLMAFHSFLSLFFFLFPPHSQRASVAGATRRRARDRGRAATKIQICTCIPTLSPNSAQRLLLCRHRRFRGLREIFLRM